VAPFRVVLDANVLYPFTLRDTLLRAAEQARYQLDWSAEILEKWNGTSSPRRGWRKRRSKASRRDGTRVPEFAEPVQKHVGVGRSPLS
jgi:hypothetical protein